jgi:hypothetical protein
MRGVEYSWGLFDTFDRQKGVTSATCKQVAVVHFMEWFANRKEGRKIKKGWTVKKLDKKPKIDDIHLDDVVVEIIRTARLSIDKVEDEWGMYMVQCTRDKEDAEKWRRQTFDQLFPWHKD